MQPTFTLSLESGGHCKISLEDRKSCLRNPSFGRYGSGLEGKLSPDVSISTPTTPPKCYSTLNVFPSSPQSVEDSPGSRTSSRQHLTPRFRHRSETATATRVDSGSFSDLTVFSQSAFDAKRNLSLLYLNQSQARNSSSSSTTDKHCSPLRNQLGFQKPGFLNITPTRLTSSSFDNFDYLKSKSSTHLKFLDSPSFQMRPNTSMENGAFFSSKNKTLVGETYNPGDSKLGNKLDKERSKSEGRFGSSKGNLATSSLQKSFNNLFANDDSKEINTKAESPQSPNIKSIRLVRKAKSTTDRLRSSTLNIPKTPREESGPFLLDSRTVVTSYVRNVTPLKASCDVSFSSSTCDDVETAKSEMRKRVFVTKLNNFAVLERNDDVRQENVNKLKRRVSLDIQGTVLGRDEKKLQFRKTQSCDRIS